MPYISKEEVKAIREELKQAFPSKLGWKLSIVNQDGYNLRISIMEAPVELRNNPNRGYEQVNHYYLKNRAEELSQITEIANRNNYDRSDVQNDYFDVGYYLNITIGKWDTPFVLKKC